jgi:transcriptional regulator with XRE-family HTH domain
MKVKIGNRIKELRIENNLTQEELGEKFNLGKSTISNYENNNRLLDIEILIKYAEYFNVSVDYIACTSNSKLPESSKFKLLSNKNISELFKVFSERVKNLMFINELTSEDISNKINISKADFFNYIIGTDYPSMDTLKKITKVLNTTLDYLFGIQEEHSKILSVSDTKISSDYFEVINLAADNKIPAKVLKDFIMLYSSRY